jgi:hypothetical protein
MACSPVNTLSWSEIESLLVMLLLGPIGSMAIAGPRSNRANKSDRRFLIGTVTEAP